MGKHSPLEGGASLVLFVAGEPDAELGVRRSGVGLPERLVGVVLWGPGVVPRALRPDAGEPAPGPNELPDLPPPNARPWHLPPSQMASLQVVADEANRQRRRVLVVDVDRPGAYRDLVERWVRPDDLLPILVRFDGSRLVAQENFTSAKVRQFLAST